MNLLNKLISLSKEQNILRLFMSFFVSEFGGYLTNTVILFYVFNQTDGDMFFLGLSQILFVGPLTLGGLVGGAVGESFNRKSVMLICESLNLVLITVLCFMTPEVLSIILVRAVIVFFAGMYNPSRQAIVAELSSSQNLQNSNILFTSAYAILHTVGPLLGAYLYKVFGGVREIFAINAVCYTIGLIYLWKIQYSYQVKTAEFNFKSIFVDIKNGFNHVWHKDELNALLKNFSIAGICLGVFYPTLLPFIKEVFSGDETTYGYLMVAMGGGGVFGSLISGALMRRFKRGQLLVSMAIIQASLLLAWTQTSSLLLSYMILFIWGVGIISLTTIYINYVQVSVEKSFQARTFSLYDQTISLNVVAGAAIVSLVGQSLTAYELLSYTALGATSILFARLGTRGMKALYTKES